MPPKSVKKSRIVTHRSDLGEYTSDSDSSKNGNAPALRRSRTVNPTAFRTPDLDSSDTDYGLEFTTSNIQNALPHRSSTRTESRRSSTRTESRVLEDVSASKRPKSTGKENRYNSPPSTSANQRKGKRPTNRQGSKEMPTTDTGSRETLPKATRRRKQRTPQQLEKRFWKEVQRLQSHTGNLIPMLPFARLVREIMMKSSTEVTKITALAMEALQTSSEMYVSQVLQDAYLLTLHRHRLTLEVRDMQLVKYFKIN